MTRVKRSVKWRDVSRVTERQAEGRRCRALDFPGESLPGADEDRDVSVGPLEYLCSTSDELAATVFRVQLLWILVQTSVT